MELRPDRARSDEKPPSHIADYARRGSHKYRVYTAHRTPKLRLKTHKAHVWRYNAKLLDRRGRAVYSRWSEK